MSKVSELILPKAPKSITKGSTLKTLLGKEAIECLANNLHVAYPNFPKQEFISRSNHKINPLGILERGHHLARILKEHLPTPYSNAISVIINSLTPPLSKTKDLGLGVFFYLPHICFVGNYGLDLEYNKNKDPFEISMRAQYELTQRFSAEFSIRPYLIQQQERTIDKLLKWTNDPNPHVRRLCSEGTRPRLPWAIRLPNLIKNPTPVLEILERLKDDEDLYVRRSVANHLGDIAKDHPELALKICTAWLKNASHERKWLIRHAVRYLAKKNDPMALKLRALAR
jgi:3-methyladenine DNA glycosylase AlkC